MRKFIFLLFVLFFALPLSAQLDSVFWFVAPEVCHGIQPNIYDSPIKLNISSFSNNPVNITISQPANSSFIPIVDIIPANGYLTIDLTSRINMIENQPANSILPYGLLIQTTGLVNIYYEINMTGDNPEIYSLKGKNALGTNFMVPGQTNFDNGVASGFSPQPLNRIDIVAVRDSTMVTITPSKNISGHVANVPFIVQLNKGETYSCVAVNHLSSNHLEGTNISSNYPIAVTDRKSVV